MLFGRDPEPPGERPGTGPSATRKGLDHRGDGPGIHSGALPEDRASREAADAYPGEGGCAQDVDELHGLLLAVGPPASGVGWPAWPVVFALARSWACNLQSRVG